MDEEDNVLNTIETSINDLTSRKKKQIDEGDVSFQIKGNQAETELIFETFHEWQKPWFSEFLETGWEIGVTAAIDFTASNGNPEH